MEDGKRFGDRPVLLIDVTPAMVAAGLDELRQHMYDTDVPYMLESVYRAMAYASLDASSKKVSI